MIVNSLPIGLITFGLGKYPRHGHVRIASKGLECGRMNYLQTGGMISRGLIGRLTAFLAFITHVNITAYPPCRRHTAYPCGGVSLRHYFNGYYDDTH